MRPTLLLLAACVRPPPATDGHFTTSLGDDDDDDTIVDTGPPTGTGCTYPECSACEAAGYSPAPTGSGQPLVDALHELTSAQFCNDYAAVTEWLFLVLDNDAGEVECVYTGRRTAVIGAKPDPSDMNTEHSWPQSLGADLFPAECDAHHLYPTDSDTNSLRGNNPFGEVATDVSTVAGGSRYGDDASGQRVFEPRDEHKGNAARSMLYFAMRYGYPLTAAELGLYRAWHALDPVDEPETQRSLEIGERQGAANPYVVCPELVDRL